MSAAPQIQDIRPEFPSADAITAYGGLCFLYMHSTRHAGWSVQQLRRIVQPPIDLKQAKIFYYEGVPRAACTWAHLDDAAERQLLLGQPLTPAQWRSGPNLWLMEIIAPYEQGTGARAFRAFMEHIPADQQLSLCAGGCQRQNPALCRIHSPHRRGMGRKDQAKHHHEGLRHGYQSYRHDE